MELQLHGNPRSAVKYVDNVKSKDPVGVYMYAVLWKAVEVPQAP
jgi:hypothetical protein